MGQRVDDLVAETEQVIHHYIQEDVEKYGDTIRALEEISFQLWVESNTHFLEGSIMSSDDELEWDDEMFCDRMNDSSPVARCSSPNDEFQLSTSLDMSRDADSSTSEGNQYGDWVVIEDIQHVCNVRQEQDWMILSTVENSHTHTDSRQLTTTCDCSQFICDFLKMSDSFADMSLDPLGLPNYNVSSTDLSDWTVLSIKTTELSECVTTALTRSFDSGIKSPEVTSVWGMESPVKDCSLIGCCDFQTPDVMCARVTPCPFHYCDIKCLCTCGLSKTPQSYVYHNHDARKHQETHDWIVQN